MAHRKAEGSTKNGRDSNPRYLGFKIAVGEKAGIGQIILRQKSPTIIAGNNVGTGKDYTLFAMKEGTVKIGSKRQTKFNSKIKVKRVISVV